MKRRTKIILITLAALIVLGLASLQFLRSSKSALAVGFRSFVRETLINFQLPKRQTPPEAPEGFVTIFDDYVGFAVNLPSDIKVLPAITENLAQFANDNIKVTISKEWSTEDNVANYVAHYFNRFILDENFRAENDITLLARDEIMGEGLSDAVILRLNGVTSGEYDTYLYYNVFTGTRYFYRIMVKYHYDYDGLGEILNSFRFYRADKGGAEPVTDFRPILPETWSAETRALYDKISVSDDVMWGIFSGNVEADGIDRDIPAMEAKLGAKFDVILTYEHLTYGGDRVPFPTEFMEKAYNDGKIVELTYQLTDNNNEDMFVKSPSLDLYRTGDDEKIRRFAREAAAFGHPFLFRLNNEMNSDWTNWSGVVNLQDPDVYVENWRTIYRIFQEEGANNAIWVWNPHDRSFPPAAWTDYLAYYPGNEYVQMLGITGYNNGDYYAKRYGEFWREFDDIYGLITEELGGKFDAFPWIITEFASSSYGGDKAKWIDGMFANIGKYERIKVAVWFSFADFDENGVAARPYWLDETDATLEAFKRGLRG
ncbi:MAG: glycoside hydrolase family 26 protein [Oscillospiraceae bacterium]|nr:glycoside hydrolase family 26 protein [Oscillospiraceae bacterium]